MRRGASCGGGGAAVNLPAARQGESRLDQMAEIVLGIGMSHGPSLILTPDQWDLRAQFDRDFKSHPYRGKTYSFDQLLAMRANDNLAAQHTPAVRAERFARCQAALDRIGTLIRGAKPDALVIVGD